MLLLVSFRQHAEINKMSYEAYLSRSEALWENTVDAARERYVRQKTDAHLFELALAGFGLLNATMRTENEALFDAHVEETLDYLKQLIERDHRIAEVKALMASVYGFKIAYAPLKGMFLGPRNTALIEQALDLKPDSPIVQKMYAQHQYFTPEMWGGNVENARRAYERSIELFERDGDVGNWMYLDNHAWLGMIYKSEGDAARALQVWNKALAAEPDYRWVSEYLIPSVQ
jgi:tetratricopeptide (TPR) repeat protein